MKKQKECPKTMSGKHIWISEMIEFPSYSGGSASGSGGGTILTVYTKCYACGIYDNRPKEKEKHGA